MKGPIVPFFYYDMNYLLLVVVSLVLGLGTQAYINSTYKRWSNVPVPGNRTGADIARAMLAYDGVDGVGILPTHTSGLDDHYDPRDNSLHLSDNNLHGASVASAAVACHEAGHAVQTAKHFLPGQIRTALVPVVNFASNAWMIVFMIGIFMGLAGMVKLAIVLFAASVLFQLVTLPVEFDASRRAVAYLSAAGYDQTTLQGARKVLTAAALTYVAAALVSCLQLLYYIGLANNRD